MSYIDGYVVPVPTANKQAYQEMASKAAEVFKENGAVRVVESWGDDVPKGKVTDFQGAVKAESNETIVFSWIEWPSKQARDSGMKRAMEDPRMQMSGNTVFDGKRMIFGGFESLVDTRR